MKYERLTKKCSLGIGLTRTSGNITEDYIAVVNRLAELEDKIDDGRLVELPCRVGDPAYYVVVKGVYSTLVSTNVEEVHIVGRNEYMIHLRGTIRKIYLDNSGRNDFAFLNKEEADAKLEELKNK